MWPNSNDSEQQTGIPDIDSLPIKTLTLSKSKTTQNILLILFRNERKTHLHYPGVARVSIFLSSIPPRRKMRLWLFSLQVLLFKFG